MEEGEEISGPWRATRLWNNIIRLVLIIKITLVKINLNWFCFEYGFFVSGTLISIL